MTNLPLNREELNVLRMAQQLAPLMPLKTEDRQIGAGARFPTLIDNGGNEVAMAVTVVGTSRDEVLVSADHTAKFIEVSCNFHERLVNTVEKLAEIAAQLATQDVEHHAEAIDQLKQLGYIATE